MTDISTTSPFSNVVPPDFFRGVVGRNDEAEQLDAIFAGNRRCVAIVGPAGIGKTTLSRVFAERSKARFPGGTTAVSASSIENAEHLISRLNIGPRDNPALLIVDDAEMLGPDGMRLLDATLKQYPQFRMIVTARSSVQIPESFHVLELGPFTRKEFHALLHLRALIATDGPLDSG